MASTITRIDVTSDGKGDLVLNLYKPIKDTNSTETFGGVDGKKIHGKVVKIMTVSRQVLTDNSQAFNVEFMSDRWAESIAKAIDMEVDDTDAVEVVFRALHETIGSNIYVVPTKVVWEAIQYCEYRQIDVSKLKKWFSIWIDKKNYMKLDHEEMPELLFPCYVFHQAKAFASMTRKLAYEMSDHITENNPTFYHHLYLDHNIIGSLNGARGSLRSKLLRGLFDPVGYFLGQSCDCKEVSLFAYNLGLRKTGIWPLHEHHKKSIQQVLDSDGMKHWDVEIPASACGNCSWKLGSATVDETRRKIMNDFHGLPLTCMKMTKLGDVDEDYWNHDLIRRWDYGCEIKHSQATWYFSFMGRKTDMARHQAKKNAGRI